MFSGDWETDLKILEAQIKDIDYITPTSRREKFRRPNNEGSVLWGYTWRSYLSKQKKREYNEEMNRYQTKLRTERPDLKDIFDEFKNLYFKDFNYTGVQLNKNYRILPHKDNANVGESVLIVCGDYIGGRTIVNKDNVIRYYDGRQQPIRFNGSKHIHWVENFTGTRYSLVFFMDLKKN